ncbi:MAG: Ig-like domain-containing protein, partial [Eggerthellaceae bacterium]|nr:Ig-like domain-containing protein [Eggerthellaceae bacterium]
ANVKASGGVDAAVIGGGTGGNGDSVAISGGTVIATGNAGGAGIGGGDDGAGTTITISGGAVEATGGANGSGIGNGEGGTGMATTITLKYAEATKDISVKANSYRYDDGDTTVTLKMENAFMDRDTREGFAAASYTGNDLDRFKNRTLVRDVAHAITVPEIRFGGKVVPDKSRAAAQETVTLTVMPNDGWRLKDGSLKATAGGTEIAVTQDASDRSKHSFTMPEADVTVTADFELSFKADTIRIDPGSASLAVGETKALAVASNPDFVAEYSEFPDTLTWASGDEGVATVDGAGKVTAVAPGTATVTATTTNGTQSPEDDKTATCTVTVTKAVVAAPAIESKAYNGQAQAADVPASDLYTVTANEGGTNAGVYDVVLTLKDPVKYKWADSDKEVKTLKFEITKAENNVAVSLKSWEKGKEPNDSVVKADYVAKSPSFEYKAKGAADSAYSPNVPTAAGDYTVRATVDGSDNYEAGSATDDFTIGEGTVKLTLVGSAIDGHVGKPKPKELYEELYVPKGSTVEDLANRVDEAAYDELLASFTEGAYAPYHGVIYVTSKPLGEYGSLSAVEEEDKMRGATALTDPEGTTLYVPLWKAIDRVELAAQAPACGTDMATDKPAVAVADGSPVEASGDSMWWDVASDERIEEGEIEGGKSYSVRVILDANFGYYFDEGDNAPVIAVAGADEGSASLLPFGSMARAGFNVTAKHSSPSYAASGDTVAVTCDDCGREAKLTIVAPTLATYGQAGASAKATLSGRKAFNAATGKGVVAADVRYVGRGGTAYKESAAAPKKAGKYTAKVTLTGVKTAAGENQSVTASVNYKIAKAANALTVKTAKKTVSASKKAQKVKVFKKAAAKHEAPVTFKKATTAKAKKLNGYKVLSVNKKTGKVTVKKNTRPGTYKLMVKVTAAKTAITKAAAKTATVTVKVKAAKSAATQSVGLRAASAL